MIEKNEEPGTFPVEKEKRTYTKQGDLFDIEKGIPRTGRSGHSEADILRKKALATAKKMEPGDSFVFPTANKQTIVSIFKDKLPKMVFRFGVLKNKKTNSRCWRVQ